MRKTIRALWLWGAREVYTFGGAHIIYCGQTAFRLINEYTMEIWSPYETNSGEIVHFNSLDEMNYTLYHLGMESLGVL